MELLHGETSLGGVSEFLKDGAMFGIGEVFAAQG